MKSDYRPHALMQNPQKWAWRTLSCRDPRKMGVACRARTISFTTSTNKACHVYVRRHTQCLNICVPCPLIAHVFFLGGVHERLLAWHDMKDVASVWHEHMRARHAFSLKWSHVGMGCMCSDIACVDMIRHVCVGCKRARAGMTRRVMPARSHSQPTQTRRAMSMCAATRNVWKYVCHAHWSPTFCLGRACGHDTPWRGFCLARARAGTTRLLFDDRQWAKGAKKKEECWVGWSWTPRAGTCNQGSETCQNQGIWGSLVASLGKGHFQRLDAQADLWGSVVEWGLGLSILAGEVCPEGQIQCSMMLLHNHSFANLAIEFAKKREKWYMHVMMHISFILCGMHKLWCRGEQNICLCVWVYISQCLVCVWVCISLCLVEGSGD